MRTDSQIAIQVELKDGVLVHINNGLLALDIDLAAGEAACTGRNSSAVKGMRSAFRWNGREYHTGSYESHQLTEQHGIQDGFGKGLHLIILHESAGLPQLEQHFYIYEQSAFVLLQSVILSDSEVKTNRLAVIQSAEVSLGGESGPADVRVLRVPFDNDKWVRYAVEKPPLQTESYEVTALFRPDSRRGMILGSVTHKVWKTGIKVTSGQAGGALELELYGGAAGEMTRDFQPHGYVKGTRVESPLVWLGFYEDYREGLEAYGQANTRIEAPLPWTGGVPVGWNSWSAAMSNLDYDLYTATSDFLKHKVQPLGFHNGNTLYINFDAFWDQLTPAEMAEALDVVRNNGHKPGTYWTPFAFWGSPAQFGMAVEGTGGKYTYADILLRDSEGEVLPDVDGGLAIDPTHPGALLRIDWFTDKFIADGFEYIKLDFLAHGALEGQHYDPEITTGIAAYHYGMSYLQRKLAGSGWPAVLHQPVNRSAVPVRIRAQPPCILRRLRHT